MFSGYFSIQILSYIHSKMENCYLQGFSESKYEVFLLQLRQVGGHLYVWDLWHRFCSQHKIFKLRLTGKFRLIYYEFFSY